MRGNTETNNLFVFLLSKTLYKKASRQQHVSTMEMQTKEW